MKIQHTLIVANVLLMSLASTGCGDIESTSSQYDDQSPHRRGLSASVSDCRTWRPGDDEAADNRADTQADSDDDDTLSDSSTRISATAVQLDDEENDQPDDVDLPGCSGPYVEDEKPSEVGQGVFEVPSEPTNDPDSDEQTVDERPELDTLEGTECSYYCTGVACNSTCSDGKLYTCSTSGHWTLEKDCTAASMACQLILHDDGPFGEHLCQ